MAVYRIHRKEWEKGTKQPALSKKRKKPDDNDEPEEFPGGGRKGVSSGLSTVVKRDKREPVNQSWWKELGTGSKGSVRL